MFKKLSDGIEVLRSLLLLTILLPLAVAGAPLRPAWDEIYYLHNAVCVARSVWIGSLPQVDACMRGIAKSPVMAMLLVPAGPIRGTLEELTLAPFALALATCAALMLLAHLTVRARIPLFAAVIAAAAAIAAPPLWTSGAPMMVDGFLAVVVACTVLLVLVEWEAPTTTRREAIRRGALWALLLTAGLMSKTTYAALVLMLAPAALIASWKRSGRQATLTKFWSLMIFTIPVDLILIRYGSLYFAHARNAAFGPLSQFYDDGLSRFAFLGQTLHEVWPMLVGIAVLVVAALIARAERGRLAVALWCAVVIVFYLVLAAGSPNKDPRFFWLVWLTLPFCVAGAIRPMAPRTEPAPGWRIANLVAVVVLSLPMIGHIRIDDLRESMQVMAKLPSDRAVSVLLATDEPFFNIESMILARDLKWAERSKMRLGTLVYDVVKNETPAYSLARMAEADIVIGRFPAPQGAPEWTNRFAATFEATLRASGRRIEIVPTTPPITLFIREDATKP